MFSASRLTNSEKFLIFFAAQSGFGQYRNFASLSERISVGCPQTGQTSTGFRFPERVRFSAICGMIIFALYTVMRSPMPSSSSSQ